MIANNPSNRELEYREITPEDYDILLGLDNFEEEQAIQHERNRRRDSQKRQLKKLKVSSKEKEAEDLIEGFFSFKITAKHKVSLDICAICGETFKEKQMAVRAPCDSGHVFHKKCLKKWLLYKKRCPLCNQELKAQPSKLVTNSQDLAELVVKKDSENHGLINKSE